jgi:outer membrane murein-binding lipoprotein Lpp
MEDHGHDTGGTPGRADRALAVLRMVLLVTAGLAIAGYLAAITRGSIAPENRLTTPEIVLAAAFLAVILVAGQFRDHSVKDLTLGTGGITARFERIQVRQDTLESEVRALQVALTGLVTKFEAVHLANSAARGRPPSISAR